GIAKQFPIIRFDAAMTLAKKHVQRLWYPEPGSGGDIASRSEYGMTRKDFNEAFPKEFWRTVVDRVQQEAPDTLLLAEAFWMMEGYFVRSLGMHRVYNSAFMNMLKNEENEKYRESVRNVLEFEPQILKRYVNFMSNPDEETAIAQFGSDDKYFGCCILMATMPGTPMFGHGQVEGFGEKYGMEYRRAYHDETPNAYLVERHQREIAPLLHKRRVFSEVEHFRLYDLIEDGGGVNENVFAYSNRAGYESCIVVYHNHFSETRGRIHTSVPFLDADGALTHSALARSLEIDVSPETYLVFRDHISHDEYIVASTELAEQGLPVSLSAFKYHVFLGFREAINTPEKPYAELAAELAGRGVPNMDIALDEYLHRHVIGALREAIQPAVLRALQCHTHPEEAHTGLVTRITALAAVIAEAESLPELPETTIEGIAQQFAAAIALPLYPDGNIPVGRPAAAAISNTVMPLADWHNTYQLDGWRILLVLPFMMALRSIYAQCDDPTIQHHFIRERFLGNVLHHVLEAIGVSADTAHHDIQLIQILTLIDKDLDVARTTSAAVYFEYLFSDVDVQRFTCVNRHEDKVYFNKERFETLVNWLALLAIADNMGNGPDTKRARDRNIKELCALAARCGTVAAEAGYQVGDFVRSI
ncbi:MAG: alpha-amylase, partial [Verrucomicrobia bacterium]|nr:alpha-amylase [Verrucomicrobiota bacterium]